MNRKSEYLKDKECTEKKKIISSEITPTSYMWFHLLSLDSERFTLSSLNSLKRSAALPSSFVYAADQVGLTAK